MRLADELREEHALIERVLGSLLSFVARHAEGSAVPEDGARFVAFFRLYAGAWHHEREEQVLFEALAREAGLPRERGPLPALVGQHHHLAQLLDELAPLVQRPLEAVVAARLRELASAYARGLWQHIDAENSVLLPESEERLRRVGVLELPGPQPSPEALAARADGERLALAYEPARDPGALRGEGCVICPSFGSPCEGVEREWWNEWEWDEFADRLG
jgi:hemerythrin-like domain-containing protein